MRRIAGRPAVVASARYEGAGDRLSGGGSIAPQGGPCPRRWCELLDHGDDARRRGARRARPAARRVRDRPRGAAGAGRRSPARLARRPRPARRRLSDALLPPACAGVTLGRRPAAPRRRGGAPVRAARHLRGRRRDRSAPSARAARLPGGGVPPAARRRQLPARTPGVAGASRRAGRTRATSTATGDWAARAARGLEPVPGPDAPTHWMYALERALFAPRLVPRFYAPYFSADAARVRRLRRLRAQVPDRQRDPGRTPRAARVGPRLPHVPRVRAALPRGRRAVTPAGWAAFGPFVAYNVRRGLADPSLDKVRVRVQRGRIVDGR